MAEGRMKGMADDPETASAPADGRWVFDAAVAQAFEDMLARSIPNYDGMREMVTRTAGWFMDRSVAGLGAKYPHVVDLGASRGSALAPLVDRFGARARYTAIEIADPMVEILEERFKGMIEAGILNVEQRDLRAGYPGDPIGDPLGYSTGHMMPPAVVLSVLTLQFVPMEYRQRLLRGLYEEIRPGGALILVEKVLGQGFEAERLLIDLYHDLKRENGYEKEAIDRKALALEGVLVPLTATENERRLHDAGFALVEPIWAWANFRAWVAVKR